MTTLVLYALLTGSIAYVVGWSSLMAAPRDALEERWPALGRYLVCPFCTGFLYGLGLALVLGRWQDLPYLGLAGDAWVTPLVVAVCSILTTPITVYLAMGMHVVFNRQMQAAYAAEDYDRVAAGEPPPEGRQPPPLRAV